MPGTLMPTIWDDLATHAARMSESGAAVYVTLNPVDPQLLRASLTGLKPSRLQPPQTSRRRGGVGC